MLEISIEASDTWETYLRRIDTQIAADMEHLYSDPLSVLQTMGGTDVTLRVHGTAMDVSDNTNRDRSAFTVIDAFCGDDEVTYAVANVVERGMVEQLQTLHVDIMQHLVNNSTAWEESVSVKTSPPPVATDITMKVPSGWLHQPAIATMVAHPSKTAIISGIALSDSGVVHHDRSLAYGEVGEYAVMFAWELLQATMLVPEGWMPSALDRIMLVPPFWKPSAPLPLRKNGEQRLIGIVMEKGWQQVAAVLGVELAGFV
jgi:hypothetical protein